MARKENPNLDIPLSEQEIWLVRMIISAIVGSFLIIAINYMQIPESVPIHFNGAGKPDAWGPKAMLWILPVIMGLVIFLLLRVSRKPAKLNFPYEVPAEKAPHIYRKARLSLRLMGLVTALMTLYISWKSIQIAFGEASGLGKWFLPVFLFAMGAAFIPMLFPGRQDSSA